MNKKSTSPKTGLAAIFSICAVMYSAYVGPGFASGTQTVSYFLNKGWIGVFIGPLIAGILCFVFNLLLFEINRVYKPNTYREAYNQIYKNKGLQAFFGTFKELQVIVVVLIALYCHGGHRSWLFGFEKSDAQVLLRHHFSRQISR